MVLITINRQLYSEESLFKFIKENNRLGNTNMKDVRKVTELFSEYSDFITRIKNLSLSKFDNTEIEEETIKEIEERFQNYGKHYLEIGREDIIVTARMEDNDLVIELKDAYDYGDGQSDKVYTRRYKGLDRLLDIDFAFKEEIAKRFFHGEYFEDGIHYEDFGIDELDFEMTNENCHYIGGIYDAVTYLRAKRSIQTKKEKAKLAEKYENELEVLGEVAPIKLENGNYLLIHGTQLNNIVFDYVKLDGEEPVEIYPVQYRFNEFYNHQGYYIDELSRMYVQAEIPKYVKRKDLFTDLKSFESDLESIRDEFEENLRVRRMLTKNPDQYDFERIRLENEIKENVKKEEARNTRINELKEIISSSIEEFYELVDTKSQGVGKYSVPEELLFSYEDGVKKIDRSFVRILKYIDLSLIDFSDVDITGVDFTDCNPSFMLSSEFENTNSDVKQLVNKKLQD